MVPFNFLFPFSALKSLPVFCVSSPCCEKHCPCCLFRINVVFLVACLFVFHFPKIPSQGSGTWNEFHRDVLPAYTRILKSMGANLQSPEDISALLRRRLQPRFADMGLVFECHVVECYRDIEAMLPSSVGLRGAYLTRSGIETPHSFVFVPRGWLGPQLREAVQQNEPFAGSDDPRDVIALVRQNMADENLSQRPVLVYPVQLQRDAFDFFGRLAEATFLRGGCLKLDRKEALKKLAGFLGTSYGSLYTKSARYIEDLVRNSSDTTPDAATIVVPPKIEFLDSRSFATLRPRVQNVAVPDVLVPWTLKVSFSRKARSALRAVRNE